MAGDIFGGIFDSITGLFDDVNLTGAIGAGLKTATGGKKVNATTDSLKDGFLPLGLDYNFQSKPSEAVESLNPDAVESAWKTRLTKFAQIEADTGVKK